MARSPSGCNCLLPWEIGDRPSSRRLLLRRRLRHCLPAGGHANARLPAASSPLRTPRTGALTCALAAQGSGGSVSDSRWDIVELAAEATLGSRKLCREFQSGSSSSLRLLARFYLRLW